MALEEDLLRRQAPQSLEAEQAVLGSILIDSRCVADVIGILRPEDFYLQQLRAEDHRVENAHHRKARMAGSG